MAVLLLSSAAMRELDRITIEKIGIAGPVLMEMAGRACAETVDEMLPPDWKGEIAVVCGKGNNGGDGMVAARYLHHWGHQVDVILLADPKMLRGDALINRQILDRIGLPIRMVTSPDDLSDLNFQDYDVILDALLGTGLTSEVKGLYADAIEAINTSGAPVVAVDIPSGLSSDSGIPLGTAVLASQTVTFGFPKPGHAIYPGSTMCGEVTVVDIGIPPFLAQQGTGSTWLLEEEDLPAYLEPRNPGAHKGHFGHLVVVAGSIEKPGAAGLCCRAASRSGAGLVTLAASEEVVARVVTGPVEYMGALATSFEDLAALCKGKQALALGPGLGSSSREKELVGRLVAELPIPMVVDADGLNNLVGRLDLLRQAPAPRILTPHPGEMARLLGASTAEVQRDRLEVSRRLASEYGCITVLKGAGSIVADSEGSAYVIPVGNPGMATGGTGDVLTGIIGSMLAQGFQAKQAALVGTYLHALAGDYVAREKGERALVAPDIIEALAPVLKRFETWQDQDELEPD